MRQFLSQLSRKTVIIGGIVLGVVLVTGAGLAGAAMLHSPTASAAQSPGANAAQVPGVSLALNASKGNHIVRVVSISGNTLTVTPAADKKGQQKTLTVSSDTKIVKYGQAARLSDIQANEWIVVRGTDAQHITQINILGFGARGTIQALSDGGFTLLNSKKSGTGTVMVNVSSSTHIQEGQIQGTLQELQAGEEVVVFGDHGSAGSLDALLVHVHLVGGQVSAINGNTITLHHGVKGTDIAVTTSSATKYYLAGQSVAASQLHVGDMVGVAGPISNKTSVAATAIFIRAPRVAGKVTGINGNTFTVQTKANVTWTITVDSSTKYLKDGQAASLTDVQTGSLVEVVGQSSGDNALNALLVRIHASK